MAISSEPGKEQLARAIAEVAYANGAQVRRPDRVRLPPQARPRAPRRPRHARLRAAVVRASGCCALGEHALRAGSTSPVRSAPHAAWTASTRSCSARTCSRGSGSRSRSSTSAPTNWTVVPCPTAGWAELVHPDLEPDGRAANAVGGDRPRLPARRPATRSRPGRSGSTRSRRWPTKLDALRLDALRFEGPGTDLSVGLLPSSRWLCARLSTVDGIVHAPNIPTEEVFTTPDPERVEGTVTLDQAAVRLGHGDQRLRVRFEGGRAVADRRRPGRRRPADAVPSATTAPRAWARSRWSTARAGSAGSGRSSTTRCSTRTPPATSRSARRSTSRSTIRRDRERMNASEIHIDFMIGSDEVAVTGLLRRRRRGAAAARRRLADLDAVAVATNATARERPASRYASRAPRRGAGAVERARLEIA